jgi:hypothetical protein
MFAIIQYLIIYQQHGLPWQGSFRSLRHAFDGKCQLANAAESAEPHEEGEIWYSLRSAILRDDQQFRHHL